MKFDEDGKYIPGSITIGGPAAPKPTPVESFGQQEQQRTLSELQQEDMTRAGRVEAAVGGVIEQATKTPIIGSLINPALTVISAIDDNVFEPLREEVSALSPELLSRVSEENPQNNFITNWRLAREYANDISIGQSWAKPVTTLMMNMSGATGNAGFAAAGVYADNVLARQPWMDEEFDLLDVNERDAAFRDSLLGISFSAGLDLTAMAIGSKGVGVGTRAIRTGAFGSRRIKSGEELAQFEQRIDQAVTNINTGVSPGRFDNALQKFMADAVAETDSTRLLDNPLVAASNNPLRASTILSRLNTADDVANYLKAERGSKPALEALFKSQASAADALDNYGVRLNDPLTDWQQIHALPDEKMAGRLAAVLEDIRQRDGDLANALDNFGAEKGMGIALSTYQPSRNAAIEMANTSRRRMKAQAQFGDGEIFGRAGDSGWKTKLYQSDAYDRAVRVITWAGTGRPQGHINITNPRRYEAQYDILSELNRLDFLKGREGADFKREMVREFAAQTTDTARAAFFARMERRVMLKMAEAYGVRNVQSVGNSSKAIMDQLDEWYKNTSTRRQSVREFLDQHKLLPDEDGNINVINLGIRANEPSTLPMLDFKRLELEVIRQVSRSSTFGENPISARTRRVANIKRAGMGIGTFFDIANMTFSNLNLLRLAYIPKNSFVDPYMRASMDLESAYGTRELLPGTSNFLYNRTLRLQNLAQRGTWMIDEARGRGKSLKRTRKEFDKLTEEFIGNVEKSRKAEASLARVQNLREQVIDAIARERGRLDSSTNSRSMNAARTRLAKQQTRLQQLDNELNSLTRESRLLRDVISGSTAPLSVARRELVEKETSLATIRSKRRRIGEEDFTIEVDGQSFTIPGLANPNVKGANAYLDTISAMEDFYAATRRSEIANDILASRNDWVTIPVTKWEQYTNAIAHVANRQLRNELDEFGGMVLRGADVQRLMDYLYKDPAGREYLRRMADRLPDRSRQGVQAWVESTRADILRMFPDEQMRKIVLERDISVSEVDAFLRGRTDLPQNIKGPDIAAGLREKIQRDSRTAGDISPAKALGYGANKVTDWAWRILSEAENKLVRNGLYMRYVADELRQQIEAAKRAGIDVNDQLVHQQLRQQSYRLATERIEQTLYSARRLTNAGYIMRYVMAFPAAYYNSQVVAARLLLKNPANAMWYSSVIDSMDGFNPYMDEDGNVYAELDDIPKGKSVSLQFPMYDWMGKIPGVGEKLQGVYNSTMGLYTDPRGGGTKVNPKQMEFMVGDPTVSWIGSILLSEAIKEGINLGPLKVNGEQIDKAIREAVGDDVYEETILWQGRPISGDNFFSTIYQGMMPSYLKSLSSGTTAILFNSDTGFFGDRRFAADVSANTKLDRSLKAETGEREATPLEIIKATGYLALIKALTQFTAPISVSFDPVTRAKTEEYQELLDLYQGDYRQADDAFVKANGGVGALALLGSSNDSVSGLAATLPDIQIYRKHSDLMYRMFESTGMSDPGVAGLLSFGYGDDDTEYNQMVAEIYRSSEFPGTSIPMLRGKTMEEWLVDPDRRMGWYEWSKLTAFRDSAIEQNGLGSTASDAYRTSGLKQFVDAERDRLRLKYPAWGYHYDTVRSNFWSQTFEPLKVATDDPEWMAEAAQYGAKWSEIADWVNAADNFYTYYNMARRNPEGGKPDLKTRRENFGAWHFQYVNNASPEFQAFAERWLSNIPELEDLDESELLNVG